jgi:heme exporter protein C
MQSTFSTRKSADTAISIITLVGLINLPIVKKSVDWWNTLHQPASIKLTNSSSIAPEMLYPLLISIIGFYLIVLLAGLMSIRAEIAHREINKDWFKNLGAK